MTNCVVLMDFNFLDPSSYIDIESAQLTEDAGLKSKTSHTREKGSIFLKNSRRVKELASSEVVIILQHCLEKLIAFKDGAESRLTLP